MMFFFVVFSENLTNGCSIALLLSRWFRDYSCLRSVLGGVRVLFLFKFFCGSLRTFHLSGSTGSCAQVTFINLIVVHCQERSRGVV